LGAIPQQASGSSFGEASEAQSGMPRRSLSSFSTKEIKASINQAGA
jgi:hypothetical protein